MEYISSAVQGASASVDAFARHRKLDAACTDEDKVAPGEQRLRPPIIAFFTNFFEDNERASDASSEI